MGCSNRPNFFLFLECGEAYLAIKPFEGNGRRAFEFHSLLLFLNLVKSFFLIPWTYTVDILVGFKEQIKSVKGMCLGVSTSCSVLLLPSCGFYKDVVGVGMTQLT